MSFMINFFHIVRIILTLAIFGAIFPFRNIKILYILLFPLEIFTIFQLNTPKGKRLARAFTHLGPTFIKLGQSLSTRPDIIGDEVAFYLENLRDRLPPFSTKKAIRILEQDFGTKIEDIFIDGLEKPIAAASIAQIYKAVTIDGKQVAVKIIRPNITKKFKQDIKLLYWLASLATYNKSMRRLKVKEVVETFEASIKKELDLRLEAAAANELKLNNKDEYFYIPEINWQLVSKRAMVLEWIEGVNIDNIKELSKRNYNNKRIAKHFILSYLNQVYRDGFFHADMHPGNIIIDKDQHICAVDFGIMGRLSKDDRRYVTEIFYGFLKRDYVYVAEVHLNAGYIPRNTSVMDFAMACRSIGEPIVGMPVKNISISKMLAQLFKITEDFGMETQPQLLLLQKTMLLIEGISYKLDPDINIWEIAKPWMENWAKENLSVKNNLKDKAKDLLKLPNIAHNLLNNSGDIMRLIENRQIRLDDETIDKLAAKNNLNKLLVLSNLMLILALIILHA